MVLSTSKLSVWEACINFLLKIWNENCVPLLLTLSKGREDFLRLLWNKMITFFLTSSKSDIGKQKLEDTLKVLASISNSIQSDTFKIEYNNSIRDVWIHLVINYFLPNLSWPEELQTTIAQFASKSPSLKMETDARYLEKTLESSPILKDLGVDVLFLFFLSIFIK